MPQQDYAALAKQFGGQASTAAPEQAVDYAALARELGGASAQPDFATSNERDAAGAPVVRRPSGLATIGDQMRDKRNPIVDVAIGAGKGVLNTVVGLGELWHMVPGVSRAVDALYSQEGLSDRAFTDARSRVQPTNTAQRVGFTAEQIGEFFVPVSKAGKVAHVAKSAGTTLAQTGSPVTAGVSGALTAVLPGGGAVKRGAQSLKAGAQQEVVRALGPTKEWAKIEAKRLAPQVLERGVRGSREAMLQQAAKQTAAVGSQIDDVLRAAAESGQTVPGRVVRQAIAESKNALLISDKAGRAVVIPGTERVVKRLGRMAEFVASLGDDIPIDKAVTVRRAWDQLVSKAGLYGKKAMASATDSADAWATREGATAFRKLLNSNPKLEALNAEYVFWKGLRNVLKETGERTQAQSGGLVQGALGGSGAIVGGMTGNSLSDRAQNAIIGGLAGRQLIKVIQSPAFRTTVTGPMKDKLADALASAQAGRIADALHTITVALPAQVTR